MNPFTFSRNFPEQDLRHLSFHYRLKLRANRQSIQYPVFFPSNHLTDLSVNHCVKRAIFSQMVIKFVEAIQSFIRTNLRPPAFRATPHWSLLRAYRLGNGFNSFSFDPTSD